MWWLKHFQELQYKKINKYNNLLIKSAIIYTLKFHDILGSSIRILTKLEMMHFAGVLYGVCLKTFLIAHYDRCGFRYDFYFLHKTMTHTLPYTQQMIWSDWTQLIAMAKWIYLKMSKQAGNSSRSKAFKWLTLYTFVKSAHKNT